MPGYKTHDKVGIAAAAITVVPLASMDFIDLPLLFTYSAAVIVGTIWLSPDLDTDSMIHSRWGIFWWYWYPYKVILKHRHFLSHSGPLSATIRVAYLLWPAALLMFYLPYSGIQPYEVEGFLLTWTPYFATIWLGLVVADTAHTLTDFIVSGVKRARY